MKRAAILSFAVVVALTACGGDDDSTTTPTADAGDEQEAADGPVTIEHRYGETTIDATPERIVTVDPQWTDTLVALDAPLVAAASDTQIDGGRYPWQDVIPDAVESIEVSGTTLPIEAIAAQQPDLIVAGWAIADEQTYDSLSQIAPTIALLGDGEVDTTEDIVTAAGEILGRPDDAAALLAETQQVTADLRAELPGLDGSTYAFANYVPGDGIYVVVDPAEGSSIVFEQLGLTIDPDLAALAEDPGNLSFGRLLLSLEQVDQLDADLLVLLTNGADPEELVGYDSLPAVESGAVVVLDVADATGLNLPSPLSIPHVVDSIRPALEAAAGAGA